MAEMPDKTQPLEDDLREGETRLDALDEAIDAKRGGGEDVAPLERARALLAEVLALLRRQIRRTDGGQS
jgi:hypothetical protein